MTSLLILCALWADEPALYFGSPGGTVSVAEPKVPEGPLSIEFRFKTLEKIKNAYKVVSRWDPSAKEADRGAFFIELGASGKISFGLLNAAGVPKTVTAHVPWKDQVWHHVSATWDGAEASVSLDGKKAVSEKFDGPLAPSKLPLLIGYASDPKSRAKDAFEGFLSDFAIWTGAHEPEPRTLLTGQEPNLAFFLPLRGKVEGTLSPSLVRAGWCTTPGWLEEKPDRPIPHLFSYDPGIPDAERQILVRNDAAGEVGILWQEKKTQKVNVTWVPAGLGEPRTVPLKGLEAAFLAAGASDARGNLYYLMIEGKEGDRVKAAMYLSTPEGKLLKDAPFDTAQGANNIYQYGGRWVGSMAVNKDSVGLILPRTMHMSGDGLRHQGAIAVTFGLDLSKPQNLGQTSGHSFGNLLTLNEKGEFLGLDLGDNYPRGVHLHRIERASKTSRVIFTYKTAHGTSARGGSPPYPEISTNGRTFYKWSNDNATYTELGGLVEGKFSYSVFFSTDRSPEGKVLDNGRIGIANEPRDLAMLRIVKNFEKAPGGTQVSDALMAGPVPSFKPETGGFYDFGGKWVDQRVTGVLWLTHYAPGEAAHSPQVFPRRDGGITILWEKSGGASPGLWAITVDESGKPRGEAIGLGVAMSLGHEMLPVRLGTRIFSLAEDRGVPRLCFLRDD